ncbi:extracellular matrix protein 1-like isoform X2 [Thalassophryne amazonica]|uniref:extracellular matrix protein 1-like isoform X2 n=1 Tax=Thalassophryne amazonica TaxID=390379 RepID=UPI001471B262|nr:extracellular matrix protein 1-like isoform X2 [Thalassophryne amazonica]
MGSFRVLLRSAAFLLFLVRCWARHDEIFPVQREVTFDIEDIMKGDPLFAPRGFGRRLITEYPVQFPPGQPNSTNLEAICLNRDHRPLYPNSYFPSSGFGQLKRKAHAVNTIEAWFGVCCQGYQMREKEVTLCCVTQVWELGVDNFCKEASSVKDRLYHCCRKKGGDRLNCFQNDAPNPNYEATEVLPVTPLPSTENYEFDPSTCQRTEETAETVGGKKQKKPFPSSTPNIDINFPPGRPTATEIDSLCLYRKSRPLYNLKCLPRKGYGWLARQAKSVNRVEKRFKQCCRRKENVLTCADMKWREEMDRFCNEEKGAKVTFPCCEKTQGPERYDCFQAHAPQPRYDVEPFAGPAASAQEHSLSHVCDTHHFIKRKLPASFPLQVFVKQCCPLAPEEQSSCIQEKIEQMSQRLCSLRRPVFPKCCRIPSPQAPECFSTILMDAVTKASSVHRPKKKKCPLS